MAPAQNAAKKQRQFEYTIVFTNGEPKRIKRPATIGGTDGEKFIQINADPTWLKQNELGEVLYEYEQNRQTITTPDSGLELLTDDPDVDCELPGPVLERLKNPAIIGPVFLVFRPDR